MAIVLQALGLFQQLCDEHGPTARDLATCAWMTATKARVARGGDHQLIDGLSSYSSIYSVS